MRKLFVLMFMSIASIVMYSSDLLHSMAQSPYTYFYKISNKDALRIYKKKSVNYNEILHTKIDSVLTAKYRLPKFPEGHYVKVWVDKDELKYELFSNQNFHPYIYENGNDLSIKVLDTLGRNIANAKVKVGCDEIKYNTETQTYFQSGFKSSGLLSVEYHNHQVFQRLKREREYIPTLFRPFVRAKNLIKYTYRDIKKGRLSYRWERRLRKIEDFLDDPEYYRNRKFADKWSGFVVFNKPMYKPNDTVRFKAFIKNRNTGRLLKDSVKVSLDYSEKGLMTLAPYSPGFFESFFVLNDSLTLKLDKYCNLRFCHKNNNDRQYLRGKGSFKYEDYELKSVRLNIRTSSDKQYVGDSLCLFVKGTNENNLNLLDARLKVKLLIDEDYSNRKNVFFEPQTIFPDTVLYEKQLVLKPKGETKLMIPWQIMPKANFSYKIEVELLTSDNETKKETKLIDYLYKQTELREKLNKDSLEIGYFVDNKEYFSEATVIGEDQKGNVVHTLTGKLPLKLKIDPYIYKYKLKVGIDVKELEASKLSSGLEINEERTDSFISFKSDNPRNIPFNYFVYKQDKLIEKGVATNLDFKRSKSLNHSYFLYYEYLWAGAVTVKRKANPYVKDKLLHIEVSQPTIIYPGQKTKVEITATQEGKPLKDVDITAYALTDKFSPKKPSGFPSYSNYYKRHKEKSSFRLKDIQAVKSTIYLDSVSRSDFAGLDTVEYYKFLFPEKGFYLHKKPMPDSLTQFAPFVVNNGRIQVVNMVYIDSKPVYIGLLNSKQPYSFAVMPGKRSVQLRLNNAMCDLGKLDFEKGVKTIVSVEKSRFISKDKLKPAFTKDEMRKYSSYILPIRNNLSGKYNYFEQDGFIYQINSNSYRNTQFVAPISPNKFTYTNNEGQKTQLDLEPRFEYDFSQKNVVKMREFDLKKSLVFDNSRQSLLDSVLTESQIIKQKQADSIFELSNLRSINERYKSTDLNNTTSGKLVLDVQFKQNESAVKPLNVIVFNDKKQICRVMNGTCEKINGLQAGTYSLYFIFQEGYFAQIDSIKIIDRCTNYIKKENIELSQSPMSVKYNLLLERFFAYNQHPTEADLTHELILLNDVSSNKLKSIDKIKMQTMIDSIKIEEQKNRSIVFNQIQGVVLDDKGETAIGAMVKIPGTTIGTLTDFNGAFTLSNIPTYARSVEVSYMGFETVEVPLNRYVKVALKRNNSMELENLVVTGYGVSNKSDLTCSVASVSSQSKKELLAGKMAGLAVVSAKGSPEASVTIRVRGGASVTQSVEPLYIVDGFPVKNITAIAPSQIASIDVLKDASATAIYGAQGANGVIIITTKDGAGAGLQDGENNEMNDDFVGASMGNSSVRNRFSDYAYWQPRLKTDKNGKASFEVTYPDDVTKWKSYVLAIKGKNLADSYVEDVKSFKPIMGQISVPRFLTQGDSVNVIGKALNYLPDTVAIKSSFSINKQTQTQHSFKVSSSITDMLPVKVASSDTLSIQYKIEKEGGYFDGEERKVPVFKSGLLETTGLFAVLDADTTFTVTLPEGKTKFYLNSSEIDLLAQEMKHLMSYEYLCNEQMASKLKAYLAYEKLCKYKQQKFEFKKDVKYLIKQLNNNKNEEFSWGWWNKNASVDWITHHVYSALLDAKSMGYDAFSKFDSTRFVENAILRLESSASPSDRLSLLEQLKMLKAPINYAQYISKIDTALTLKDKKNRLLNKMTTLEHFRLIRLKQECGLEYSLDSLRKHQKSSMLGSVYYSDGNKISINNNDVHLTVLAYKILKVGNPKDEELLKIRNWFYEKRTSQGWTNTYESANIIDVLYGDIINIENVKNEAKVVIQTDKPIVVTKFPYELELSAAKFNVSKSGSTPVFFAVYQQAWNENPKLKSGDFVISSEFENKSYSLKSGVSEKMNLSLEVKKDAEFVQIEIPIPGGCSYDSKEQSPFNFEVHREFYKNKVLIYCQHLPKGKYDFSINLLPRFTGKYILNPAQVRLMYYPTFSANNELQKVVIK